MSVLTQQVLLSYRHGLFPMAEARDDPDFFWVDPELRGQLPILDLHIPKRLERTVRTSPYRITINTAFEHVIDLCAESARGREETWINRPIRNAFVELHRLGQAHSVEVWDEGQQLIGGLYGLALGQIFCGESMFSRARDASKIALVHLCARLYAGGFKVLDTQFVNDHLTQFGVYEVTGDGYRDLLSRYMDGTADFIQAGRSAPDLLQAYLQARHQRRALAV